MSSLPSLLVLLGGMCIGTFLCGTIPLSLPLSRTKLRALEVLGAGLLVGAAMTVVVPEGVGALYRCVEQDQHAAAGAGNVGKSAAVRWAQGAGAVAVVPPMGNHVLSNSDTSGDASMWSSWVARDEPGHEHGADEHAHEHEHEHEHEHGHSGFDPENAVGMSLLAGFLIMLLIDQLTSGGHDHTRQSAPETHRLSHPARISLSADNHRRSLDSASPPISNATRYVNPAAGGQQRDRDPEAYLSGVHEESERADEVGEESQDENLPGDYHQMDDSSLLGKSGVPPSPATALDGAGYYASPAPSPLHASSSSMRSPRRSSLLPLRKRASTLSVRSGAQRSDVRKALSSILGLVIHAAADGIAMGASASSGDESLRLVVFFAIMIHKAPASFGLCTLLMSQRLRKSDIRKAVALFSLSTPLGAIATYIFLGAIMSADPASGGTIHPSYIGIALTFSGGTFLYVAMHAMQELGSSESSEPASSGAGGGVGGGGEERIGKVARLALLIVGTLVPRTLQALTGHHH